MLVPRKFVSRGFYCIKRDSGTIEILMKTLNDDTCSNNYHKTLQSSLFYYSGRLQDFQKPGKIGLKRGGSKIMAVYMVTSTQLYNMYNSMK